MKPVRAGQGIGRGGAQRNPCEWKSQSSINPVRGDRLCVNTLLPPRWGLDVCAQQLQGFHSASPRYTPAYALFAPSGAFPRTLITNNPQSETAFPSAGEAVSGRVPSPNAINNGSSFFRSLLIFWRRAILVLSLVAVKHAEV